MKHQLKENGKNYKHLAQTMDQILELRYSDLEQELKLCKQLLKTSQSENYIYGQAFAKTYIGDYYIAKNMGNQGKKYLKEAESICKKQKYNQLLIEIYIFLGICYDMLHDIDMSLNSILEALEISMQGKDTWRKSIIINNIANFFETYGDMNAAKKYYAEALECMKNSGEANQKINQYAVLISNLIYLSCHFGEIEQAENLLTELDEIKQEDLNINIGQLYISQCHIAAAKKDLNQYYSAVEKIMKLTQNQTIWGYEFFEILIHIARYCLELNDDKRTKEILTILDKNLGEQELGSKIKAQKLWVKYHEKFGTEKEQGWAYKKYYKLKEKIDITNNEAMVAGLHAKINLKELAKQQKKILKERKEFENQSQKDELTKLHNRRYLTKIIKTMQTDQATKTIGIALIDIDYFKQYNDTYGHNQGDSALKILAKTMQQVKNNNENIHNIRYGGDEFIILYKNTDTKTMENLLKNLTNQIKNQNIPHQNSKCSNQITLTIGYTIHQINSQSKIDTKNLLEKADQALYKAKKQGRNQYISS